MFWGNRTCMCTHHIFLCWMCTMSTSISHHKSCIRLKVSAALTLHHNITKTGPFKRVEQMRDYVHSNHIQVLYLSTKRTQKHIITTTTGFEIVCERWHLKQSVHYLVCMPPREKIWVAKYNEVIKKH